MAWTNLKLNKFILLTTVTSLVCGMSASALASHRHHFKQHHFVRHYGPGLNFYPLFQPGPLYGVPQTTIVLLPEATHRHNPSTKLFAYPAQGQSAQRQSNDQYECHTWAATESGFDPVSAVSSSDGGPPAVHVIGPSVHGPSDPLRGAIGGATLGALGGAAAGNAGIGAAIGCRDRQRRWPREPQRDIPRHARCDNQPGECDSTRIQSHRLFPRYGRLFGRVRLYGQLTR